MKILDSNFIEYFSATQCSSELFSLELDVKKITSNGDFDDVHVIFEEFNLDDDCDANFVLNFLIYIKCAHRYMENTIDSALNVYIADLRAKGYTYDEATNSKPILTTIYTCVDYFFGCFHLTYHSPIDLEHGIGVLVKNFEIFKIGSADIRFREGDLKF